MMSSKCDSFKDKIADLISGTLPDNDIDIVHKHTKECRDCFEFEQILRAEDRLLTSIFQGLEADLEKQEDEVVKAISCFDLKPKDKILAAIRAVIDNPVVKLTAAAVLVVLVTFNCIRTMSWLYQLERFMDACTVTMK